MIYLGHRKTKQNISKNKDVISFLKANGVFFIQEVGLHEKNRNYHKNGKARDYQEDPCQSQLPWSPFIQ